MSSLSPKDRVSLCSFAFSDGRRCRTPRISSHPHFCFYHAQKEARTCAVDKLGKDLAYFFSGDYLSACDLSTALARLIPAVVRGEVKPKTAHTVAYLFQTLMQAIHVSQHEYCEAFSDDAWRQGIRNSVKLNHNYLFPPDPAPAQPQSSPSQPEPQQPVEPPVCHSERSEESASSSNSSLATRHFPNNRPLRRTLPCLPRAPNSLSMYWLVFRPVSGRPHNQPRPRPARQSQLWPLQLPLQPRLPPHLRLQRTRHKHPPPTPQLLPRSVILSVAKDLIPSAQPNPPGRQCQPLNPHP